jgi:hypothetical protein
MREKLLAVGELLLTGAVSGGPTDAGPGTVRKVAVLCVRQDGGLPLWHPDDATGYGRDAEEW